MPTVIESGDSIFVGPSTQSIEEADIFEGVLAAADDGDRFGVNLIADQTYTITISGLGENDVYQLDVFPSSGDGFQVSYNAGIDDTSLPVEVVAYQGVAGSGEMRITFVASVNGPFDVGVSRTGSVDGDINYSVTYDHGAFDFTSEGDDTFTGTTGDDSPIGGDGDDYARLGRGADQWDDIVGTSEDGLGNDSVYGENGDDFIAGGFGDDFIDGGLNNDTLLGEDGNDAIYGRGGDDSMSGGDGSDNMNGGSGNDTMYGGLERDLIFGGPGADYMSGDEGNDRLTGSRGNDTLDGGAGNDLLVAGQDDDLVLGGADDDKLIGQSGNDTLYGGEGNDTLNGSFGFDTFVMGENNGTDVIATFDDGFDRIDVSDASLGIFDISDMTITQVGTRVRVDLDDTGTNAFYINNFNAADLDNTDFILGTTGTAGTSGNDTMTGTAGQDHLVGLAGDDSITGGADSDLLEGGDDRDTLDGEAGNDTLKGGFGNDTLLGKDGLDLLEGEAGNDVMFGGIDNDTLIGGSGKDTMDGGDGDDILFGGTSGDVMTGGIGSDTFVFETNMNADTIIDFENGIDTLDMSALVTDGHIAGFGDLTINQVGGNTVVNVYGTHTLTLQLFTATDLDATDFIF